MEQKWQIPQDLLLGPLSELKSHGFDTLLHSLFRDLKVAGTSSHVGPAEPSPGGTGGPERVLWDGVRAGAKSWHVPGPAAMRPVPPQ